MEDKSNNLDDIEIIKDFLIESNDHLENVESKILQLEKNPKDMEIINNIFRSIHNIKGSSGFMGFKDIGKVSHELETLLDEARKSRLKITPPIFEILYEGVDILKKLREAIEQRIFQKGSSEITISYSPLLFKIATILNSRAPVDFNTTSENNTQSGKHLGEILIEKGDITKEQLELVLEEQERRKKIGDILVEKGITTPEKIDQALKIQSVIGKPTAEMIKVDTHKLDNLINYVEELVIANALINETLRDHNNIESNNEEGKTLSHLGKIVKDIQDQVMSMRMVPIKPTFKKMERLVRDVSLKLGKKVRLEILGEDTELDKTVIEEIGDPLVHIVRNSIDHGIELPEERVQKGKSAEAIVRLNAYHRNGSIIIEVEDDGRGLVKEKILKKAKESGLISENAALSDNQIYNLIFAAGFSTAEKITDVSGRGVGMDVVKRNVERLRGRVEVSSVEGKGTKLSLKLPLTLAIIDGMIVEVGSERYIVPMLSIKESIRPIKQDISPFKQYDEVINVRGHILPLVRLHKLYKVVPRKTNPWEALIIVVEDEGRQCGILVDDLLNQQQVVIKSLGEQFKDIQGISGGAILSDGRVGLILDVAGIMNMTTH